MKRLFDKLMQLVTIVILLGMLMTAVFLAVILWPHANEIAIGIIAFLAQVGTILTIALIASLCIGIGYGVLWLHGKYANTHHRAELIDYAQSSGASIKMGDMHVQPLPQPRGGRDRLPEVRAATQVERLPQVRVIDALPMPVSKNTLALPSHAIQKPTIEELIRVVQPNSFTFGLGRSLTTNEPVTVELSGKHIKVIGASQMGKSCLVGGVLEQLRQTHDNDHLQLAILDLEDMTGRLFEEDNHIMSVKTKEGIIKLHARDSSQVAYHIILLHNVMLWRYDRAKQYGWDYIDKLPRILIYFEEFLYWLRTLAQFVTDKQTRDAAIAAITGIATRGLKVRMHLVVAAQVGYRDEKLIEAMAQFVGINVSFAVIPSAARAAGFVDSKLISDNFRAKKPGQYVVETIGGADVGIAPDFDIKERLKTLGGDNHSQEYSEIEEAGEFEGIETLPVVTQEQQGRLHGKLRAVYDASQELNTTNKRVIAAHLGLSDSMVYRLLQQLKEPDHEQPG